MTTSILILGDHLMWDYPALIFIPGTFWDALTDLNRLHQVISQINRTGYAHQI